MIEEQKKFMKLWKERINKKLAGPWERRRVMLKKNGETQIKEYNKETSIYA